MYKKDMALKIYKRWYAIKSNLIYIYIHIYIYKEDVALNYLQRLISHKTQPNQTQSLNLMTGEHIALKRTFGGKYAAGTFHVYHGTIIVLFIKFNII